jgi:hypothetical protein
MSIKLSNEKPREQQPAGKFHARAHGQNNVQEIQKLRLLGVLLLGPVVRQNAQQIIFIEITGQIGVEFNVGNLMVSQLLLAILKHRLLEIDFLLKRRCGLGQKHVAIQVGIHYELLFIKYLPARVQQHLLHFIG